MIDITLQELSDIVDKLNNEIFDQIEDENYSALDFTTNGSIVIIGLFNVPIWDSEDDMRNYINETDEYEKMEKYLRREINDIIQRLAKIKL